MEITKSWGALRERAKMRNQNLEGQKYKIEKAMAMGI